MRSESFTLLWVPLLLALAGSVLAQDRTVADPTPPAPATEATQAAQQGVAGEPSPSLRAWRMYPDVQSVEARYVDVLTNFINLVTVICFVGIIIFMVYFAIKFRRRDPHQKALSQKSHNTALELGWTIPPLILVFVMFYYGFIGFLRLNTPPDNAYTVRAVSQKWAWSFMHPNGRIDAKDPEDPMIPAILHVPAGEPVVIRLESTDVLHSLGIPAFRVKKDAVPGRYTYLWFEAIDPTPGHYDQHAEVIDPNDPERDRKERDKREKIKAAALRGHVLFCSEFCGTDHSNMLARVVVHPKGWRPAAEPMPVDPIPKGKYLFTKVYQCNGCHAIGPTPIPTAPSFYGGFFGRQEPLEGGGTVTVDEAYVRDSIISPNRQIVRGYQPLMPDRFGTMPEDHLDAIIEYLKSLGQGEAQ